MKDFLKEEMKEKEKHDGSYWFSYIKEKDKYDDNYWLSYFKEKEKEKKKNNTVAIKSSKEAAPRNDTIFIHYGDDHFDRDKFNYVKNASIEEIGWKPAFCTCLWASPIDDPDGWHDWCEANRFRLDRLSKSFKFKLKKGSRVLEVITLDDLTNFLHTFCDQDELKHPIVDFESIAQFYDALFVKIYTDDCEDFQQQAYWQLYGWDVDSLLIFNPDIVEEINL